METMPATPPRAVTIVAMLAVGGLTATVVWASADRLTWFDLGAAVVACGLVLVAMVRPFVGGLVLSALVVVSPVVTPAATFAALNVARRQRFTLAATVAVAGIGGHALQGWLRSFTGLPYGWWLLLMGLAYLALLGWGTWGQARQALLLSLQERARRAEAEQGRRVNEARLAERARIAREMHDVLAHRLSLLAVYAGALEYRPDSSPERLATAAGIIRTGVHQALEELREVITVLRQDPAEPDGPPGPGMADVPRLIAEAREVGSGVEFDDRIGLPVDVAPMTGRTAYRIVQEALTNARKHAAGQPVTVTLDGAPGGTLVIDVRNPLSPRLPELPGAGLGLVGLTERVGLAGGRLDHAVDATGEFHLRAELPWRI